MNCNHLLARTNKKVRVAKNLFTVSEGYLAAMGKPGGGRNEVDPRFISMFSVCNVVFPADETLNYVYRSILSGHLQIFSEEVQAIAETLVQVTLSLYQVLLL